MGNATADLQDQSAIETDEGATCGYSQHDQSLVDMEDLRDRMAANDLETQGAGYKVGDKKGIYGSSEKDDHTLYNMTCQGIGTSCTVWVQDGKTFDGDTEESVKNLIRIGSCGAYDPKLNLYDIILGMGASTDSNYAAQYKLPGIYSATASWELLYRAKKNSR